jgi:hypothetical protein
MMQREFQKDHPYKYCTQRQGVAIIGCGRKAPLLALLSVI